MKLIVTKIILASLLLLACSNKKIKKKTIWKETVGTIDVTRRKLEYVADGKEYSYNYGTGNSNYPGEKYVMSYNISNPEDIKVEDWHKVFLPTELTTMLPAKVVKIHKRNFWLPANTVTFTYTIGDHKFEKVVALPPNFEKIQPGLNKDQVYIAEVLNEDVDRVVLHLDVPISDTTQLQRLHDELEVKRRRFN